MMAPGRAAWCRCHFAERNGQGGNLHRYSLLVCSAPVKTAAGQGDRGFSGEDAGQLREDGVDLLLAGPGVRQGVADDLVVLLAHHAGGGAVDEGVHRGPAQLGGQHSAQITGLPSGVYTCVMRAGGFTATERLMVLP